MSDIPPPLAVLVDDLVLEVKRELATPYMSFPTYVVRGLVGHIDALQAIVDKLPKCWCLNENDELVQDCPVTPDMELWCVAVDGVTPLGECDPSSSGMVTDSEGVEFPANEAYSTRAAAEAAQADKDKGAV